MLCIDIFFKVGIYFIVKKGKFYEIVVLRGFEFGLCFLIGFSCRVGWVFIWVIWFSRFSGIWRVVLDINVFLSLGDFKLKDYQKMD